MQSKGNTPPLLVGMQTLATTLEISMEVSQKIGSQPTSGSSSTTLGHIHKSCSITLQRHLFIHIHSSIVCTIQNLEQPTCSSTKEWIQKMWHIYTLEYYSEVKTSDILKFTCKWIELENTILSEVTQTLND